MEKISTHENHKKELCMSRGNQNGIVLILSLVFMCILALLGSTAVMLTTTDMKIGDNYKSSTQAFSAAQAGVAEAVTRLKGSPAASGYAGDTGTTADPLWSAYILTSGAWTTADDPEYDSNFQNYFPSGANFTSTTASINTLQSAVDVGYFVKLKHKREYDAEQSGHTTTNTHYDDGDGSLGTNPASSPGSIVYYGDDPITVNDKSWVYFTTAGTPGNRDAWPVEIVRSYGESNGSLAVVEVELRRIALNIATEAAIYAKDTVTSNGTVSIDGHDQAGTVGAVDCGGVSEGSKPPFYTCPSGTTVTLNGTSNVLAGPDEPYSDYNTPTGDFSGDIDIPISDYVAAMGLPGAATEVITADQNNAFYGADGNGNSEVCYCDATVLVNGLSLSNVTGYGLLAVEGDLILGGGFDWHGLILVTGTMTFNGGGAGVNITGAVLANQTVAMNGGVTVQYDSCYIQEALQGLGVQVARWRQVY
jgi:Tfp pilus assembly protein PilX